MKTTELKTVIDIGTNSARMLNYRIGDRGIERLNKRVLYTRMGQDVNKTGRLHPDAIQRNIDALCDFKSEMDENQVTDYYVFGTSALRDASNREDFLRLAKEKTGLDVQVISGEKEAEYGFLGVSQSFEEPILIFDIGGGSTELIVGKGNRLEKVVSINMGCVRGTELYLKHDQPTAEELTALALDFDCRLRQVSDDFLNLSGRKIVGIGGTATTLAAIDLKMETYQGDRIHKSVVTKKHLDEMIDRLCALPLAQRKAVIGLDEKRADVIIAGCVILDRILTALKSDHYTVCDYDNLEGAAYSKMISE